MLTVHHISKLYGIETILQDVSFSLNQGERLGLVGPNGCGKTTLLRILTGAERQDQGVVHFNPPALRVGYLAQGLTVESTETLGEFITRAEGDLPGLTSRVERLSGELIHSANQKKLQKEYDIVLSQLEAAAQNAGKGEEMLGALGLEHLPRTLPVASLSGGQKTRLMLASLLLSEPNLLLLDEPTNHLDIPMLKWLEDWLRDFNGAALIVSHDRAFLDNTVSRILDLNPETHTVREYFGNYSFYLEQILAERKKQMDEYRDQVAEIRHMKQDIVRTKQQAKQVELSTTPRQPHVRRVAKKVARKAASREKKLERYIESNDRVEQPKPAWQIKFEFNTPELKSHNILVTENLAVGYVDSAPLLEHLNLHILAGERITLTGPNGSGKTTLLRTIVGQIMPLAGNLRLSTNVKIGYMTQEQESLEPELDSLQTILKIGGFNETEARAFLSKYLFKGDDVFVPAAKLSYGERARLMLASLVAANSNFLILDEPINHLDIPARTRFEEALANFEGTILAVVHDRYFIENFASGIWGVADGGIERMNSLC
jgi:ATP-binding cassette, subfamily F, member 3